MRSFSISLFSLPEENYPPLQRDPDILIGRQKDAAGISGTLAQGLFIPQNEAQLVTFLRKNPQTPLLVQGARTSLTGGATPQKDILISLEKWNQITQLSPHQVRVSTGVYLRDLLQFLAQDQKYYPPVPTFDGATLGGTLATNAAGAATFKYGTTREWVLRIRMILRNGDILDLTRGQYFVEPGDEIVLSGQSTQTFYIPTTYQYPPLKKASLGYYVRPHMDLIDFFIGNEGTLGIFSEADLKILPRRKVLTGLVFFSQISTALACTKELREKSLQTQINSQAQGIDIRSIEYMDNVCLKLLRSSSWPQTLKVSIALEDQAALLFELELETTFPENQVQEDLFLVFEKKSYSPSPITQLAEIFQKYQVLDRMELAFPEEIERHRQLCAIREAVPICVNEWIAQKQKDEPLIYKCAGDMIVPFEKLEAALQFYQHLFEKHSLQYAIWGHVSDGNVHPNVLPRTVAEMKSGQNALREMAQYVKEQGGCPMSEHGVGKHPLKKQMLIDFFGTPALEEMKAIKAQLDPFWTLGRGILFDPPSESFLSS